MTKRVRMAVLWWLFSVVLSPQAWAADEPGAEELSALFAELTSASLREKASVIERLAERGGLPMAAVFDSMAAGNLVYSETTGRVYHQGSKGRIIDLLNEDTVVDLEPDNLEKIRVNNPLRQLLHRQVARIHLMQGSVTQRRQAALSMMESGGAALLPVLEEAMAAEEDAQAQQYLQLAIALAVLDSSSDQDEKLAAINALQGRLESPVRNALNRRIELDDDPVVREAAEKTLESISTRIRFYRFIEQLVFGLSLGSVLLLAAIGLAVTFGVMGVINMAHGEMLMLGAYTTYVVQQVMPAHISASIWVSIPAAFVVAGLAGMLIQRFVIRYLEGRPLETLLATFGISLILQQTVRTVFSPLNRMVSSPEWLSGSLQINPVLSLTYNRLYILVFALLVFAVLQLVLKKTSLGLNVRAVAQNRAMARAMGIRTEWVDALTFGLGTGIAGIAGVALSQLTNVGPGMGQAYIIDSFMVVVFGGVGNLVGTLIGAFAIGTASNFLEPLTGSVLAKISILVFIILFIQKKPNGLFPQKGRAAE